MVCRREPALRPSLKVGGIRVRTAALSPAENGRELFLGSSSGGPCRAGRRGRSVGAAEGTQHEGLHSGHRVLVAGKADADAAGQESADELSHEHRIGLGIAGP